MPLGLPHMLTPIPEDPSCTLTEFIHVVGDIALGLSRMLMLILGDSVYGLQQLCIIMGEFVFSLGDVRRGL